MNPFRSKLALVILALAAAVPAISACGDDGGGSEPSPRDRAEITRAIESGFTSAERSRCARYFTTAYSQQFHFSPNPRDAITLCIRDSAATAADSATASNIEVDGDTATADAKIVGGPLGDQTISLELVKQAGHWKVDRFTGFADFDRASFNATIAEGTAEAENGSKQLGQCLVDSLNALSDHEIEDLYVGGDPNEYAPLLTPCFGAAPAQ